MQTYGTFQQFTRRGSYANHAMQFGTGQPVTARWCARQIVLLNAMLVASIALRQRGTPRRIARQIIRMQAALTGAVTAYGAGRG